MDQEAVPDDVFCELYRELALALKKPSGEAAVEFAINDAIQLREAFDRALVLAGVDVDLARRETAFNSADSSNARNSVERRDALGTALETFINDQVRANQLLCQALGELVADPQKRQEAWERRTESIINDKRRSEEALQNTMPSDLSGERAVVAFLEAAHPALEGIAGDALSNGYFGLLTAFIEKFSLRYDLRRPCQLCPTLPGVFASLVRELRAVTANDAHLDALMKEFESAIRDLRTDSSEGKIKTCIQKHVNLLEAVGGKCRGVTEGELGKICGQLNNWPHAAVKSALKNLYGFTSDYPGIRHGGNAAGVLRQIEMRDMVAMCILLTGFSPYLTDQFNAEQVYLGT
jgi:hypothetical protein